MKILKKKKIIWRYGVSEWVISKFNGTSTPKRSYSAKTGLNCLGTCPPILTWIQAAVWEKTEFTDDQMDAYAKAVPLLTKSSGTKNFGWKYKASHPTYMMHVFACRYLKNLRICKGIYICCLVCLLDGTPRLPCTDIAWLMIQTD